MVPWVATTLCVAESMPPYETVGTGKFYVSYEENRCLKDCPVGGALCGGIVTESHLTLYDNVDTCCSQKLWWLGSDCVSNSMG